MARQAVMFYPVVGFLFIRFIITFILLLPLVKGRMHAVLGPGLILGGLLSAIFLCETLGVAHTRASNAAFLISLCIVLTPLFEWLIFRQRPGSAVLLACLLSLCGAGMLTGAGSLSLNVGDALMLAAAVLRALMVCLTRLLMQRRVVSALALTAVQTGTVAGLSLILLLLSERGIPPLPLSLSFWGPTLWLVLACTLFAFFAQNYAVQRTTPTRASLLMGSEPLFGALFASLWLQETLSMMAWCGGFLMVAASLWAIRCPRS